MSYDRAVESSRARHAVCGRLLINTVIECARTILRQSNTHVSSRRAWYTVNGDSFSRRKSFDGTVHTSQTVERSFHFEVRASFTYRTVLADSSFLSVIVSTRLTRSFDQSSRRAVVTLRAFITTMSGRVSRVLLNRSLSTNVSGVTLAIEGGVSSEASTSCKSCNCP